MSTFWLLPLSLLVWRAWVIIYRLWFHPLSHVPGPFLGCISNLYRIGWFIRADEHLLQAKLHDKYGPILRYSPNKLIISDASLLPLVYNMKADKTDFTAPNFGNVSLFTLHSHKDHVLAKRRIAYAYSMKNVQTFEPHFDERVRDLMSYFLTSGSQKQGVDLLETINWLGLDIISELCFGQPFGFVKQQQDVRGLIKRFTETAWLGEFLGELDNLSWYIRNTGIGRYLLVPKPTDEKGIGAVMGERDRIMEEMIDSEGQLKGDISGNIFLNRFLQARNKDGSPMSMVDVKAEILLAIQAGSENASLNLSLVIFNVARHPRVQAKLQQELDAATSEGVLPDLDTVVSYNQAFQLPYLGACIRESLRYSSSITQIARKAPQDTGLHLNDTYVPPEVSVSTSAWIIGRDKDLYGEDAFEYRPERWTEASEEHFKRMEALDFVFGHGARRCLGRHVAMIEIWKTIAEIFRRFDVEFLEPENILPTKVPGNWNARLRARTPSAGAHS